MRVRTEQTGTTLPMSIIPSHPALISPSLPHNDDKAMTENVKSLSMQKSLHPKCNQLAHLHANDADALQI
jgi:hypothetical protein